MRDDGLKLIGAVTMDDGLNCLWVLWRGGDGLNGLWVLDN